MSGKYRVVWCSRGDPERPGDFMSRYADWCKCGEYPLQEETKESMKELEKVADLPEGTLYKCSSDCKECPQRAAVYRSDSCAGMAGSSMSVDGLRRSAGRAAEQGNTEEAQRLIKEWRKAWDDV